MVGSTQTFKYRGIVPRSLSTIFRESRARDAESVIITLSCQSVYHDYAVDLLAEQDQETSNSK
jgi:hypothetical protein